jgi:formylglycine-generating enzyme required for sulfatase activity
MKRNQHLQWRAAAMAMLAASCAPEPGAIRPQWIVVLYTDAPVPAVADRLLVEVTNARGELACSACRRILEVSDPSAWPVSFGVAFSPEPLAIRARMYLARDTSSAGEPPDSIGVDVRAQLPAAGGKAIVELGTACFGVSATQDASCDPATGQLSAIGVAATLEPKLPMQPGTFGAVAPCPAATSRPNATCISGGLFLLRDAGSNTTEAQRKRVQLVQITSFEVDRDEFSVGRFRALALADSSLPAPRLKSNDRSFNSMCTYVGKSDAQADSMPLNCVTRAQARRYCEAAGARLVRDAEFAYMAGNGARATDYPWGAQLAICNLAVVGRGPIATELDTRDGSFECRALRPELPLGPVAIDLAGTEGDTALGVRALAGNLAEWSDDDFAVITADCWRGRPLLRDPLCRTASPRASRRGGSWLDPAYSADARYHESAPVESALASVGFRCARDLPE